MTKRMLIDATHAEETRVVVLEGSRLEDFDVETQSRKQLKGNIYLAKVVRVEPSLQAAFVEYGGNRHGFLAFGEIHPDYYQIPVADRQRLLQMQEEEARAAEEAEEAEDAASSDQPRTAESNGHDHAAPLIIEQESLAERWQPAEDRDAAETRPVVEAGAADHPPAFEMPDFGPDTAPEMAELAGNAPVEATFDAVTEETGGEAAADASRSDAASADGAASDLPAPDLPASDLARANASGEELGSRVQDVSSEPAPPPETLGGEQDPGEEVREQRTPQRYLRSYKIQEVIRRRQILLIQVVKEERGSKGAALTTYISLAGRYCVLMPNSPRGGGISRKITSVADRRRLKEVTTELEIPRGMGLIVRTAGANRPKPEIKRDGEYLLRLWDEIRDHTMRSMAPALIYEEASLIKRAIRDVYSRDVDEVLVDGEDGWRAARDFMRMLMPAHVKKVQLWRDDQPLFAKQMVEAQLDSMLVPTVQLRSGGYLVIDQTEALVAIDVNSGRSTRERGIEQTALATNLEAADEVARQLRLRDLAGLIVIDFIDMESKKNNAAVERRMKEALKNDRARIQVGSISHFGLLELSRQRLRPSIGETSLNMCTHCGGTGHVRSIESSALHVLREIEEEGGKRRSAEIMVHVAGPIAFYILNNKRQRLTDIEARHTMKVCFAADDTLLSAQTRLDRVRALTAQDLPPPTQIQAGRIEADRGDPDTLQHAQPDDDIVEADDVQEDDVAPAAAPAEAAASRVTRPDADADAVPGETEEEGERRRRRRRRRRRGGKREDGTQTEGTTAADARPDAEAAIPPPPDAEQPDLIDIAFAGKVAIAAPTPEPTEPPAAPEIPPDQVVAAAPSPVPGHDETAEAEEEQARGRPRGKRGGRRRKRPDEPAEAAPAAAPMAPSFEYNGPTPANPFGNVALDIFDVLERAEAQHLTPSAPQPPPPEPVEALSFDPVIEPASPADVPLEPVSNPAIKPMLVGSDEASAEKKRGWWRR